MTRSLLFCLGVLLCAVAASSQAQTNMVEVTIESTPPGASVYLDGQPFGFTPLKLNLNPGFHWLKLTLYRHLPRYESIEISDSSKRASFSYELEAGDVGTLMVSIDSVRSDSPDSIVDVVVDGVSLGKTPLVEKIPLGDHRLELYHKDGYQFLDKKITITESKITAEKITTPPDQWKKVYAPKKIPKVSKAQIELMQGNRCCSDALRQRSEPLRGVWGSSSGALFAVGEGGVIERSLNSGSTWNTIESNTTKGLYALWGSKETILAVGDEGTILRSVDGGQSWSAQASDTTQPLYSVWGSDLNHIYIAGDNGTILFSADQGATWVAQESGSAEALFGVVGRAGQVYIVGEYGKILRQEKSGDWSSIKSGTNKDLYSIMVTKSALLIAGKDGTLLRSVDGIDWLQQKAPQSISLYSLSQSGSALYAVGNALLRSLDGGLSWVELSSSVSARSSWATKDSVVFVGE